MSAENEGQTDESETPFEPASDRRSSNGADSTRRADPRLVEPGEAPKVQYPWVDPMNPSRWKEEHVRRRNLLPCLRFEMQGICH